MSEQHPLSSVAGGETFVSDSSSAAGALSVINKTLWEVSEVWAGQEQRQTGSSRSSGPRS